MSFKLRIFFSGLCLFVPRRDADNKMRVHVLMPNVSHGHHQQSDRHVPVLKFDTAHLRPSQEKADKVVGYRDLSKYSLRIGDVREEARESICPQIVRLRDVTQRDIPDNLLEAHPGTAVLGSRVTLTQGAMALVGRGKCWEWSPGQAQRMAHVAVWEMEVPTADLHLSLIPLGAGMSEDLPVLHPIGAATEPQILNLMVHHLPPDELAPVPPPHAHEPAAGEPAWHFAAYYDLYGSLPYIRLPRYAGSACLQPANHCPEDGELGSSAYNCMLGSGG